MPASPRISADPRDFLIYEDTHVLAFDKPTGLAVQGGGGVEANLDDMLAVLARSNGKRPRLAHRLDRETSGVILAGRTHPALVFLNRAFAERAILKRYLAIVCGGAPAPAAGLIEAPLARARVRGVDIVRTGHGGQDAATGYATLAAAPASALVEAQPRTGRMHQIRAHLAHIGRPIAGDGKYGGLFAIGAVPTPQLLLHALEIDVPHPAGGRLRVSAPPPPGFAATAAALGLASGLPHTAAGGERHHGDLRE